MGLTRKKPIPRKRSAPRRYRTPRCETRGCRKPQEVKWANVLIATVSEVHAYGLCRSHAKAEADRRFSLCIRQRDGSCRLPTSKPCSGPLQCCHLISRRFLATRWDEDNAVAGCRTHHAYWTANPDRWAEQVEFMLGPRTLDRLRRQAFDGPAPDLAEVLSRYPGGASL